MRRGGKMIYIIGGCYLTHQKEECIVVKNSDLMIEEMTNIVGALGNLYYRSKEEFQRYFCPPKELLPILCELLKCKDRKHKYMGELDFIETRIQSPILSTVFVLKDELLIWIDVKEAMIYKRDSMWGTLYAHFNKEDVEKIEEAWKKK